MPGERQVIGLITFSHKTSMKPFFYKRFCGTGSLPFRVVERYQNIVVGIISFLIGGGMSLEFHVLGSSERFCDSFFFL
jgi:hypothetical protein